MSVNIGPKIELQGEKEFKSQITNVTTATKSYKAELEAAKSAIDKNASAEEKAKKTREALTTAIDKQKAKVDQLKSAVDQAEASGNVSENTLNRAKTALANATIELNKMEQELDSIPSKVNESASAWDNWNAAADKIGEVSAKVTTVGDNMTKYVSAPITAVGAAGVAAFKALDSGYDTIITKTGATGDGLADLKEQANDLFTSMNVSMDDVGTAIGEVNTKFGLTGDECEDLSRKFLEFAKINSSDVNTSIDNTQKILAAFNMDASEAGNVLDVLTTTGQATGASVDSMASAVVTNAAALQQLGLDAYQSVDALGKFEMSGVDSNTAVTGLTKALKNATEQGIPLDQALLTLEDTIRNGTSETDGLTAAYDLFGKSGAAVYQGIQNGTLSFTNLATSADVLNASLGSVDATFQATQDPIDSFQIAMNSAKVGLAELGTNILVAVAPAIQSLSTAIHGVTTWFSGLSDSQQRTIITIGGVVAAVGPLLSGIGRVGTGVSTVMKVLGAGGAAGGGAGLIGAIGSVGTLITGTVIPAIGSVLAAIAPALPIIAAVAAAIAAVILIVKNWGKITEWFKKVWTAVTTAVSNAAAKVKEGIVNAWNSVKEKTTAVFNAVKTFVSNIWNGIKTAVTNAVNGVKNAVTTAFNAVRSTVTSIWNGIKSTITTVVNTVSTTVSNVFNGVRSAVSGVFNGILSTARTVWNSIKTAITTPIETAKATVQRVIDAIKGFFHFEWSLPHLKLPHLTITGGFSLVPPAVPKFSIQWYKKAYNEPMLFRSPTVIPTASGLKGFGDGRGGEVVMGQSMMYAMIRDAVASGGTSNTWGDINVTVNGAESRDMGALADLIADRIAAKVQRRRAAWA